MCFRGHAGMQREAADLAGVALQRACVTGQCLQRDDLAASVATGGDAVGAFFNIDILDDADEAAELYYLHWNTDLGTNNEDLAYAEEKREFALLTYAKVFINGIWQEEVKYVQNLDDGARAEAARVEAERLADEAYRAEQLRIAQEAADAQKAIAEALAKEAENGNNSSDDKETGSSDIGSWGPFAAIAAIIAAIAAIFPFLSGIVKF